MRRGILSVLFILSLATAGLPAQQADPGGRVVVAVLPLVHEMEARELAAAGRVVMDTIALTLRILGGYQVVRPEEQASERNLPRLRELAESSGYDNILFGSSTRSGSGSLAFTLSAYDRKQDRITVTRTAVAESLFDLFDLSDRLAAALVEGFSGVHVAFGSLKIDRRGGPGTWHLAVNGERVGENLSGIDRLPTGRHRVSVTQDRLLGTLTLFDGEVTVAENGIATVLIDLPFTTPEEAAAFSRLDRELLYAWARPPIASTTIWEELYALLRKGAGAAEYAELAGKYEEWESRYRRFHRNTASVTAHREPVPAAVELLAASTTPAAFRSALPGGVPLEAAGGEAGSDNATLSSIVEGSFNFFLAEGKIRGQSIAARAMNADVVSHPASDDRSKTELRIRASAGSDQVTVSFNLDGLESGREYSVKEGDRYNCAIDSTILLKQVGFMSHPVRSGTLQIQRFDKAVLAGSFSFTTGIGDTLEGRFLLSGLPYRPGRSRPAGDGFVLVEAGTFRMGSTSGEGDERPQHRVTLTRSFYISPTEVTQEQWTTVMGDNPSASRGGNLPVDQVSWFDAVEYCNRLSLEEGLNPCYSIYKMYGAGVSCDFHANGYRLPTEAEWEYAARGGKRGKRFVYSGSDSAQEAGWHAENAGGTTHPVGQKRPNALGLFDMSGNVWEWCWDLYGAYGAFPSTNPAGPSKGSSRVIRGGSWIGSASSLDVANRSSSDPLLRFQSTTGLRLVRTAE